VLYCKGLWSDDLCVRSVAVVGTRALTDYGRAATEAIVRPLAQAGVTVISGLAMGIDAVAHEVLLEYSDGCAIPVAVVPGGPDSGFPEANRGLYRNIIKAGAVVSEHPSGTVISRHMFASRNRIIAGLSRCVVVVEAPKKSGALITADLGLQYGKDVCAVPGSIFSRTSDGTNDLLKQGAHVVRDGHDVLDILDGVSMKGDTETEGAEAVARLARAIEINFSIAVGEGRTIAERIFNGELFLEELVENVELEASVVRSTLTRLQLEGILSLESNGKITHKKHE